MSRILHLTFSNTGGAGKFASNLHRAQRADGINSDLAFFNSGGISASPLKHPSISLSAVADKYLVQLDSANPQFSYFRKRRHLWSASSVADRYDVIHLHWTAGVIDHQKIFELASMSKVVWTLHDMYPFTAGCHHAVNCTGFKTECGNCPQVKQQFKKSVAADFLRVSEFIKSQLHTDLTVVSPSQWLLDLAKQSSIFENLIFRKVANPVNHDIFRPTVTSRFDPKSEITFGFCASNLSDPNKNIQLAISQLYIFACKNPNLDVKVIAIGENMPKVPNPPRNLTLVCTGSLNAEADLAAAYNSMDIFLNPSLNENYPTTLLEALACGVPCIALNVGGSSEIVTHEFDGLLLSGLSELALELQHITNASKLNELTKNARISGSRLPGWSQTVAAYQDIYHS